MATIVERGLEIGIRELRDGLSRYLAKVREGHEITVTDRGRPIARIVPTSQRSVLDQLIAEGRVTPAKRPKEPIDFDPIPAQGTVSDLVSEMREERQAELDPK